MRRHSTVLFSLLVLLSAPVTAEQMYVEDKLVLNVYAEADQGSERVATIETGDVVETIEQLDKFSRVRLTDGREGWVATNFLTVEPPAILKLREVHGASAASAEAATKPLTEEVARLKKHNAKLEAELANAKKQTLSTATTFPPGQPAVAPAAREPAGEANETAAPVVVVQRSYWWAWLLAVGAAGSGGFAAGYQTLGRRVRTRFGGVKVY